MREAGEYVEFAPGEVPKGDGPEVLTAGERTEDGGVRMYYFYPETHPEVLGKRQEMRDAAPLAVRRLLAMILDDE